MPLFESRSVVVEKDVDGSVFLKLDVPDRSLNVFTREVMADLDAALDHVKAEKNLPILIIRSGKASGFLAGADLNDFLAIQTSAEAEALSARGQAVFDKLAGLPMPTLAVISGPCLGGGLEFALACDYRLVYDKPSTQLGLPEVQLGLLPGWGGTQRLPRVVGLERALMIILGGKRLSAPEARRWGLADALAASEKELRLAFRNLMDRAVQKGKRARKGMPIVTWRQRFVESHPLGRRLLLRGADRMVRRRTPDDMPAPIEALEAVRVGLRQGEAAGLAYERAAAGRLAVSNACRNLIGLFLQGEAARKLPAQLRATNPPEARWVGVVGAGAMGAGIAQLAAFKGVNVIVQEVSEEALGAGILRIQQLFDKAIERRLLTPAEGKRRLGLVRGTITWEGFKDIDLVIEAAVENLDAKRAVFRELEARCRPTAVLATNTSSLSVARIQEGLKNPERIAGLHFFNPVHKMPLVEVARTPATQPAALAFLTQWAIALGKTPVQVKDSPGFVVNRILFPYLNEAVLLVAEGLKIEQIDGVMKRFGMPMGPLELLDEIGLDLAAHVAEAMQPLLAGRFEPNPGFEKMRANEWLGQKNNKGFYLHKAGKRSENVLASNLLKSDQPRSPAALPLVARLTEGRERMVLLMVNEAALVLGEELAEDASAIDLAMVLGTGWAPHRGGPLRYGEQRKWDEVLSRLTALAGRYGKRFEPCAVLKQKAESQV
jgi:3-hydroxyacyl-CoA dehydrogenase / enoyl-CoA hydratase / 3-hydroxybutyryl-CoA epimerase